MQDEIIKALEEYYWLDDEKLADVIFWLANHIDVKNNASFVDWLDEQDICSHCGGLLEPIYGKEIHWELEENPSEEVYSHRKCNGCGMCVD